MQFSCVLRHKLEACPGTIVFATEQLLIGLLQLLPLCQLSSP